MPLESSVELSDRLRSYLEAWADMNPEKVSQNYLDDATHRGPGMVLLAPEIADHTLRGAAAIRQFVKANKPEEIVITYRVHWALETESTSVAEYEFMSPEWAAPGFAVDIIEWSGDKVKSVRAYALTSHF